MPLAKVVIFFLFALQVCVVQANIDLDDELYIYPLCGHDFVKGRAASSGCPKVEKIFIFFDDSGDIDARYREFGYRCLEKILNSYRGRSTRRTLISVERLVKERNGFATTPTENSVILDVKVEAGFGLSFTVISPKFYYFNSKKFSVDTYEQLNAVLQELLDEYIVPSLYPDLRSEPKKEYCGSL